MTKGWPDHDPALDLDVGSEASNGLSRAASIVQHLACASLNLATLARTRIGMLEICIKVPE
jgi:hypothetical protein